MAQEQVLEAVYALVTQRVQAALPATQRGLRARDAIRARVPTEVRAALDRAVQAVVDSVRAEIPEIVPFAETQCDTCGNVGMRVGCPTCGRKR